MKKGTLGRGVNFETNGGFSIEEMMCTKAAREVGISQTQRQSLFLRRIEMITIKTQRCFDKLPQVPFRPGTTRSLRKRPGKQTEDDPRRPGMGTAHKSLEASANPREPRRA